MTSIISKHLQNLSIRFLSGNLIIKSLHVILNKHLISPILEPFDQLRCIFTLEIFLVLEKLTAWFSQSFSFDSFEYSANPF